MSRSGRVINAGADIVPSPSSVRVALYARISTKDKGQDTENQLRQLREYCERAGYQALVEYIDQASGSTSVRPEFQRLMADARQRRFDLVLFWSLDRFSREGVTETLNHLQRLTSYGVNWRSHTEQYLDSCGIFREAVLAILAVIAKQERVRISERTLAGLARAKAKGKRLGRPKADVNPAHIRELRAQGLSYAEIADETGVGRSTIARLLIGSEAVMSD
jgi:DNA invertase Pin-like site-specific DNA recombinase